jgi:hypothetical protein
MPRTHRAMRLVGCATTLSMFVGLAACGDSSNPPATTPDPVLASITLASGSVVAGSTVQGTASLDRAAKSGGANVSLSSSNTSIATVPGSVLVPEGAQSANFTVTGMAAGSVTITGNFGGSRTATVNVTPPPLPVQIAVFSDPPSSFMTSDVRDVQGQIVQFDTANNALIWAADSRSFSGYPVSGTFIGADRAFQVRFGTDAGERRAYFTETGPETICDIDVVNGQLVILPTNVRVPGGG